MKKSRLEELKAIYIKNQEEIDKQYLEIKNDIRR